MRIEARVHADAHVEIARIVVVFLRGHVFGDALPWMRMESTRPASESSLVSTAPPSP